MVVGRNEKMGFIVNWWKTRKLRRLLEKMDRCCSELEIMVTEPDEWLVVQDLACCMTQIIGLFGTIKEVFQRTK